MKKFIKTLVVLSQYFKQRISKLIVTCISIINVFIGLLASIIFTKKAKNRMMPIAIKNCKRGEAILKGTLRVEYSPATYRTKANGGIYKFRYVDIGDKFEIDILSQPSYGRRSDSASVIHRLPSARGGTKICVSSGMEPRNIESAKNLSVEWAELTDNYIKTGKLIDDQVRSKSKRSFWDKWFNF